MTRGHLFWTQQLRLLLNAILQTVREEEEEEEEEVEGRGGGGGVNVPQDLVGADNKARKQETPRALKPRGSFRRLLLLTLSGRFAACCEKEVKKTQTEFSAFWGVGGWCLFLPQWRPSINVIVDINVPRGCIIPDAP